MKTQAQTLRFAPAFPAFARDIILSVSAALAARRAHRERQAATKVLFADPGFLAEFGHALPGKQGPAHDLAQMTPAVLAASLHTVHRDGRR
jgi:hypothetical protein